MSDISNSDKRRLPFPLYDTKAIVGYSPDDGFSIVPLDGIFPDETTRVPIRLDLSLQEYVALASSVDVGRDIAYGDDSEWIWWIWVRAFRGASDVMSCEDVENCIETNGGVQDAIDAQTLSFNDRTGAINPDTLTPEGTESTTIINNRFPQAEREVPASTLVDCNLDELWAGIYFMVQKLDETGRDWLEQAVSSGDKWQRAASIAKNIPIIGSLAQTALEQLAEVAQDLLNLYNAYSTEAAQQDIACALFEMVCEDCRYPTFDEIAGYYAQNSTITGGNLAEISLKAMVDFLIGSSLVASQLAYHTIISMVLFTLYIGSEFVGLRGARWISIWLDNGEEFANDEWAVLCDGCAPEWCRMLSGSDLAPRIFSGNPLAVYNSTENRWDYADFSTAGGGGTTYRRGVQVITASAFSATITRVEINIDLEAGIYSPDTDQNQIGWAIADGEPLVEAINRSFVATQCAPCNDFTFVLEGEHIVTTETPEFWLSISSRFNNSAVSGSGAINWVKIYGTGSEPSVGVSCP